MTKYQTFRNVNVVGVHSAGKAIGLYKSRRIYMGNAIPGEQVDVVVAKHQKGYTKGWVDRVVHASDKRVYPFCKHFNDCGGCNWQHIQYNEQLVLKHTILTNALLTYNIQTPEIPLPLPSPLTVYYRNKTEYAFGFDREGNPVLGFHNPERPDYVVDINQCFLQTDLNRKICEVAKNLAHELGFTYYNYKEDAGELRNLLIRTTTDNKLGVIIGFTKHADERKFLYLKRLSELIPEISTVYFVIFDKPDARYSELEYVHFSGTNAYFNECVDNIEFTYGAQSFYQPNSMQAINLFKQVKQFGDFKGNERVVDLYTGVGTLALYVSASVGHVTGIEGCEEAIIFAKKNAKINGINNADFITGDILETFTADFTDKYGKIDVIILDPPRSGTLIEIKKTILRAAPSKIIYVSCNPVSLAFDLKQLCENDYEVSAIQPFDMFPHTHHIETVVLLKRIRKD